MDRYKEELIKIRSVLRDNPRGLTISEISKINGINRNSVAKYTDVLLTLGHIEMKRIGPAKMYYLSDRIPISAMLNISKDNIIVFNKDQKIVQINSSAMKLMNAKREDIIELSLSEANTLMKIHIPIKKLTVINQYIQKSMNGAETTLLLNVDYNGEEKYFNMKFLPTTFDTGKIGLTLIIEDITDLKKTENIIRESEEQFSTLFNALKIGVLLIEKDGNILKINPEAERIFDMLFEVIASNKLKGNYLERVRLDGTPIPSEEMAGPRARREKQRVDNVFMGLKRQDGSVTWLKVSAEPILDEDEEVDKIICFYEDITDNLKGARMLTKLKNLS